ncbi:MAG: hypothetical protein WC481_08500 [Candidatus Omnitrophota bacterium]|jgi:hypothetical protein
MEGEGIFVDAAGLSPDVVSNPAMTTFIKDGKMDVGNVIKSYLGAQELIGRKGIVAPKDENDVEGWNKVYDFLGRPKTAAEYKLAELTELKAPEGFKLSDELVNGFKEQAHKLGYNARQTGELFKWFVGSQVSEYNRLMQEKEGSRSTAEKDLRSKWGAKYDQNLANIAKLIKAYADKDDVKFIEEGVGNDPRVIRLLSKFAEKMGEDGLLGGARGFTLSPEEAKAELSKIDNNKDHPYWNAAHLEHAAAVKRYSDLLAMVSGQAA